MENDYRLSSANPDPQLLLESGPMMIKDFNPKGILRFAGRTCVTCGAEIMDHWLRPSEDADLKGVYWCTQAGPTYSQGINGTVWDVPKEFGQHE